MRNFNPIAVSWRPSPQQAAALRLIVSAVLDAIRAAGPTGAPGGVLYAACQAHGATLSQFESLMRALERAGKVERDGDCYHIVG